MDEPPGTVILFRGVPAGVRRMAIERFARTLRDEVAGGSEFECLIANDAELQRLNREFRRKDYPTDVLSFPNTRRLNSQHRAATVTERLSPKNTQPLGSLAISYQRAAAQARQLGHSLEQEIQILMLHGLLHLLGFDHETDRGRMARVEADWRQRLALPVGLIERAHR